MAQRLSITKGEWLKANNRGLHACFRNLKALRVLLTVFILCGAVTDCKSQLRNYKVVRNGNDIGWLKLERYNEGDYCRMFLNSGIKFRMLVLLTASVFESAYFFDGKLVYSSQQHRSNGKLSVNKQTRLTGNGYEVTEDNANKKIDIGIVSFNLLCLYFQEPVSFKKVYCDNQQYFADIERTSDGGYKVRLPNGNSNCFYYSKGICTRVKINHTFYSAEIILDP